MTCCKGGYAGEGDGDGYCECPLGIARATIEIGDQSIANLKHDLDVARTAALAYAEQRDAAVDGRDLARASLTMIKTMAENAIAFTPRHHKGTAAYVCMFDIVQSAERALQRTSTEELR